QGDAAITASPRGFQPALHLRDGIPMVDAFGQIPWQEKMPIESLKRIEVVTGPGGVLWGADSFLGIVNLITKDGEDVDGLEVGASYGDGRGDRSDARTYALFGESLFSGGLKLFAHAAYTNYVGEELEARQNLATSLPPQPAGPVFYGPYVTSNADRSWLATFDGKVQAGPFRLFGGWSTGKMLRAMTVPQGIIGDTPPMTPWGSNP